MNALEHDLYVPAVSSLLIGIEATLRVTIQQVNKPSVSEEPSPYHVLSNKLLLNAHDVEMPVEKLAFPDEKDFLGKLNSQKPNRIDVDLVRIRNNICHGNVFEFINSDLGEENRFFTPECLRDLTKTLLSVSKNWASALGSYRADKLKGIRGISCKSLGGEQLVDKS